MFKIRYVGPRPVISQHGISYKEGKEDKYIYLISALNILYAIDHDYTDHHSYSSIPHIDILKEPKIHKKLQQYDENLEIEIANEEQQYEEKIEVEIESIKNNKTLNQDEKDVWIKNIKIMKEYRIQRAINKIYYIHCIEDITKIIKKQRIKEIDEPFNERNWHVLHSIQGLIETTKPSFATKLVEETKDDGVMIIKLFIYYGATNFA